MKIFESDVYILDKDMNKNKFKASSNKDIFVGYPRELKESSLVPRV